MIRHGMEKKRRVDKIDAYIGNRVKTRRSLLGLTQDKLAKALGVTFQQLQKYEKGSNRLSAGRLFYLSLLLEVPIGYFYQGLDENKFVFCHEQAEKSIDVKKAPKP